MRRGPKEESREKKQNSSRTPRSSGELRRNKLKLHNEREDNKEGSECGNYFKKLKSQHLNVRRRDKSSVC